MQNENTEVPQECEYILIQALTQNYSLNDCLQNVLKQTLAATVNIHHHSSEEAVIYIF